MPEDRIILGSGYPVAVSVLSGNSKLSPHDTSKLKQIRIAAFPWGAEVSDMARVLVMDDEEPVRDILRQALEGDGHEVGEAADGQEGLDIYRSCPPDLVMVDIKMPVKDGYEVIKELRQAYPDAKIVAMAGVGEFALDEAKGVGADRSFLKPFRLEAVRRVVGELLEDNCEEP